MPVQYSTIVSVVYGGGYMHVIRGGGYMPVGYALVVRCRGKLKVKLSEIVPTCMGEKDTCTV